MLSWGDNIHVTRNNGVVLQYVWTPQKLNDGLVLQYVWTRKKLKMLQDARNCETISCTVPDHTVYIMAKWMNECINKYLHQTWKYHLSTWRPCGNWWRRWFERFKSS